MSRLAILALLAVFATLSTGCPKPSEPPACIEGASFDCACTDGTKGAQICSDKGTLGPCKCDPAVPAPVEAEPTKTAPAATAPAEAEPTNADAEVEPTNAEAVATPPPV